MHLPLNDTISLQDFPSIQTLTKETLAPHYARTRLLTHGLASVSLIAVGCLATFQPWFELPQGLYHYALWLLPLVTFLLLARLVFQWFADKAKFFALRELDLTYFSGLIVKRMLIQPLNRIQHIEVSQGPVERVANLATLHVYSAGSAAQTFAIPGLLFETAHQLRQHLLSASQQQQYTQTPDEPNGMTAECE